MLSIVLSQNKFALIDDEDFERVNKYKWYLSTDKYAIRQIGRGKFIYMHRFINKTPKGVDTDHINRNKLDNRKCNLRTASRSLNTRNSSLRNDNTSGYKGVDFYKRVKKWRVRISINKKNISLGYFNFLEDAILARRNGEILLWK